MAKYGAFVYRGGYYGEIPRLPFSVEPFQAVAVDYDKVILSWGVPQGAVNGLRIVRNQTGFGEWPEDGVVLFERNSEGGDFGDTIYIDGEYNFEDNDTENDIPLIPGRFVYYRAWVRRSDTNLWTAAESVVVVLPKEHGTIGPDEETFITTHDSVMDMLPRVFTSANQNPLDPVDKTSDLYQFLKSLSFTIDEFLTLSDLLLPDYSGASTNPALLDLQAAELGLSLEDAEFVIRQKRMVRDALYMYARKGTIPGVSALVENLTGFAPIITESPNLLLSNQDSTFINSTGDWKSIGAVTLSVASDIKPPSGEDFAIDADYSAKAVVAQPLASITLGKEQPITKGIPVNEGQEYTFSFYAISASGASLVSVKPTINWHDSGGNIIASNTQTAEATTVSWASYDITATSPGTDYVITEYTVASNVVTATTSVAHTITEGSQITIAGLGVPFDGKYLAGPVTSNTIQFTLTTSTPDATVTDLNGVVSIPAAVYASVEIQFTTTGTVYLDLIQFADSATTVFNEARGVNIFLTPSKSNYVNNPSFSDITEEWSATNGTLTYVTADTPFVYTGDTMLQVATSAGSPLSVTDQTNTGGMPTGEYYSFSVYAQCPSGDEDVFLEWVATDSVNPSITTTGTPVTVSTEWVRLSVTGYIPREYVSDSLFIDVYIKCSSPAGNVINLEAAQLEASFKPTLYIDGSFPAEYGIVWEGTADNSPSHLYKNKQQKVIRLIQELENFLPSNTPYVVESFGGIETAAITQ